MARMCSSVCVLLLFLALGVSASAFASIPTNDDFANADDLGNGVTASASGSNLWATAEAGEPGGVPGPATASVWYRWTAPRSGVVVVDTCGSNFDTTLTIFRGPALGALGRVATNDDRCRDRSRVRFFAIAGTTYNIAVDGVGAAQGSVELKLRFLVPPSNDDFANALDLGSRSTATASGTNRDATAEPREPDHLGNTHASVWYRWTAPAGRMMQMATCGSDFDTVMAVYVGSELDALRSVAGNDDSCGQGSRVRFRSAAGRTYHIAVTGFRRDLGSIRFKLTTLPSRQPSTPPSRTPR